MKNWKDIFRKISLALIVIFILQISLPTVSYAFHGFFMYSADDKKLRGYVYVKDPTKVSVNVTNQGSVTTITYDGDKVKESYMGSPYFPYDKTNTRLRNVNFNEYGYTYNTAPSKIVAFDGETSQEFKKEIDANGNVRYYGDTPYLGYYRIPGEQYLSAFGANANIPANSTLVSFTPAASDSNGIQLHLPSANNEAAIDFTKLALSDFILRDITAGADVNLTYLNRVRGYEELAQYPTMYLNSVITLETAGTLLKDHRYELSLSSTSNGNEVKLPAQGTYSYYVELGLINGQFNNQGGIDYWLEGRSGSYFDDVNIKNGPPKFKISPNSMHVGQEAKFRAFNQFEDGSTEDVTNYEIVAMTYSDVAHKAIAWDNATKKIKALNPGAVTFLIKYHGMVYDYSIIVATVSTGGGGYFQYFFEDQDPTRGQIHPKVTWMTSSESNYSGYQLNFSDANGTTIGEPRDVPKLDRTDISYKVDIKSDSFPVNAKYMDLYPKDLSGHTGTEMWRTQVYDMTSNSPVDNANNVAIPTPVIQNMQFEDQDTTLGGLGGSLRWFDTSNAPSPATSYSVYFVNVNNVKLKPIAEIPISDFRRSGVDPFNYEVVLPVGYAMPAGAYRIGIYGKNAQGESTQGVYYSFWDKIAGTLGNDYFEDADTRAGHINGTLKWTPMLNESNIKGYAVQFLGNDYEDIGSSFAVMNKGQQQYSVTVQDNQIPAGAKVIELRAVNADNKFLIVSRYNISDNVLGEVASSAPVDLQLPGFNNSMFTDLDGEVGEIGGNFSFNADYSARNSLISHYHVYFVNDQLLKIKPIMSLSKNNIGLYQTSIPMNTKVPNGATKLAVYGITPSGESTPLTMDLLDGSYSPSLQASQISIVNNKSDTADTITITGLQTYDAVRVYRDANALNAIWTGSVLGNATSLSFTLPQLGQEAGNLYFTLQRNSIIPSLRVQKPYDKEPTTGGGGGGGGPMGPVEPFKWDIINQNGKIRITSSIDSDQMKKLADEQAKAGNKEISIDLKNSAEGYDFQINAGLLEEIGNKLTDAVLVFNTTLGTTRIPFDVLQEAVKANGGKDSSGLRISIDQLPAADQVNLEKTIASNGGESVGKALSYELSLVENNKTVATIDSFSKYVGHVILLPKDFKLKQGEKLNGAVWDPASKTLISVPLTVHLDKDGKPAYATLWRKGNSIYTLYTSQKQFADVPDEYFAKADIESLAASQVIQGFEDGSFRAEAGVTRAEFATLLVRGLGIKTTNDTANRFSDVNVGDWFNQAVQTAVNSSLISGYEDGTFRPTQSITHQEAITMISNALNFINPATKLDDSERAQYTKRMNGLSWHVDAWASDAAALMLKHNIMGANQGFSFEKDAQTTRGQTALFINRLLEKAAWPES